MPRVTGSWLMADAQGSMTEAALAKQTVVQPDDRVDIAIDAEARQNRSSARLTEALAQARIGAYANERRRKRGRIARRHEQAGPAVVDDFRNASHGSGHDGQRGTHRE